MLRPAQLRAARALLNLNREECGRMLGLSPETIRNIEAEKFRPTPATVEKVMSSLADHGIELIGQRRVMGVLMVSDLPQEDKP